MFKQPVSDEAWKMFCDGVHQAMIEKGWYGSDVIRPTSTLACLYISELMESFEWLRKGYKLTEIRDFPGYDETKPKKEGTIVDIADFIIRLADSIAAKEWISPLSIGFEVLKQSDIILPADDNDMVGYTDFLVNLIGLSLYPDYALNSILSVAKCFLFYERLQEGLLWEVIVEKVSYNLNQPYKGGS